ncbi:SBBP repeat-containing protein [Aquimarina latercula]|uniref:SBBP repeat-containing protein n=1 Tax=Aquimarina latercula TaxID=987 RepID=UPI0003F9DD8C|nr:SBBP repeat-containing protein [Aquimarina latercula]
MRIKLATFVSTTFFFILNFTYAQTYQWVKSFGGTFLDTGNSIAVDLSGNIYTIGTFEGTVDFDPNDGVYNVTEPGSNDEYGVRQIFIHKMDTNGNFIWVKSIGGTSFDIAHSVELDNYGNILITGGFSGYVDFDPGPDTHYLDSKGGASGSFLLKMDTNGNFIWAKSFGGIAFSTTTDSMGNVYTSGRFPGTIDVDPSEEGIYNLTAVGNYDSFILKMDTNGNFIWAKSVNGEQNFHGRPVTTDASGNVYITGTFEGTVDFDPGMGSYNMTSAGRTDVFVLKLDTNGNFIWTESFGGTSEDNVYSLKADALGNLYMMGYFSNTVDFDPSSETHNLTNSGWADVFILKMDVDRNFIWAKSFGGSSLIIGFSMKVDASGYIYIPQVVFTTLQKWILVQQYTI